MKLAKTKSKTPQKIEIPRFQPVLVNIGRNIPWSEFYNRPQTAVGIEPVSPWREGTIFHGTTEQLGEHFCQIEKQTAAAKEAARQAHLDRERAKAAAEPQPCAAVMEMGDVITLKRRADLDEVLKNVPPMEFSNEWSGHGPQYFCDSLFDENDLGFFAPGLKCAQPYRELRDSLASFDSFDPNPRTIGVEPRRKYFLGEWRIASLSETGRRIKFLESLDETGELIAVVYAAKTASVQTLWSVEGFSQKRLEQFFRTYVGVGGEPRAGLAALPGAAVQTRRNPESNFLGTGISYDAKTPRNICVFWNPPNKPELPSIPKRGRSV